MTRSHFAEVERPVDAALNIQIFAPGEREYFSKPRMMAQNRAWYPKGGRQTEIPLTRTIFADGTSKWAVSLSRDENILVTESQKWLE